MDLLISAIAKYAPLSNDKIEQMRSKLYYVLNGYSFDMDEPMVVTSDPKEDCDDILMIYYILMTMKSNVWIILSGGLHTPNERLDHLKNVFPELKDIEFGIKYNNVTFLEDGVYFMEKVSVFVNCGPCHSDTLFSICESLIQGGRIITVGANENGSSAGINQKNTDEGVLKDLSWNKCIDSVRSKVSITNLSVDISRFILLPNPRITKGSYSNMPRSCFMDIVITTAMFICSRPPAKFALRANEGNSFVDFQLFPNIMDYVGTEKFIYGLSLIEEYSDTCEGNAVIATSAAIPLMVTALMGGVYKKGVFGFSPMDKKAKESVSCLTEESVQVFLENIKELEYFTPGYDLLAVILAK